MEKSDDQIAREKEAVASMKGAQANMKAALDRIQTLESALAAAAYALRQMKHYTPTGLYINTGSSQASPMTVGGYVDASVASANKALAG